MRSILVLLVIYLTFISLGLPDSLLGAAWPSMYASLSAPAHYAGIIAMLIAASTVVSSLLSTRMIRTFGTVAVVTTSVSLTAVALLGFSIAPHFIFLCLLAIPLGLGAGSIDASLNNYVATRYAARHMNWLHCFWGVGAALGPVIMAKYLASGKPWNNGYQTVGFIQVGLALVLIASIPLWSGKPKRKSSSGQQSDAPDAHEAEQASWKTALRIPGLPQALLVFFCYCAIEAAFGLWGASYLAFTRNLAPDAAARLVALYYGGIMAGRFLSGFLTAHWNNRQLVYIGQAVIALGIIVLVLPFNAALLPGFFLIGFGCAPIFPSMLHETPQNFGLAHSQTIMGMQMASAYVGITIMPLLFGKLAFYAGYSLLPIFIAVLLAIKILMTASLNKTVAAQKYTADEAPAAP